MVTRLVGADSRSRRTPTKSPRCASARSLQLVEDMPGRALAVAAALTACACGVPSVVFYDDRPADAAAVDDATFDDVMIDGATETAVPFDAATEAGDV